MQCHLNGVHMNEVPKFLAEFQCDYSFYQSNRCFHCCFHAYYQVITPWESSKTIKATTQRGIRTMLHPSLFRWFRTNDKSICHHFLAYLVFSIIFTNTVPRKGNRCAQVYATDLGWAKAFPVASWCKAHETLSLLFARYGLLLACIHDNAKKLLQRMFNQKLKDASFHLKHLESYTPWSNDAKHEIKEFKRLVISCWSLEHLSTCEMIVCSWMSTLSPMLPMRSVNGKVLKTVTSHET